MKASCLRLKAQSSWAAYYQEEHSYSDAGLTHKQEIVREYLKFVKPEIVWDLGANTGMFSRIAASLGAYTVAFDYDPLVVELNYREMKKKNESNLLPLLQDLTNPSPAIGWRNRERSSLIERANADLTMSLALVHHLLIANNVPLDQLVDFFYQLSRWQIIEFIPKSDHQVQRLLTSREDIFLDYSSEAFEAEFNKRFKIHRKQAIQDSARCLYLMERH